MLPATSSFWPGELVPIPTLPELVIVIASCRLDQPFCMPEMSLMELSDTRNNDSSETAMLGAAAMPASPEPMIVGPPP